MVLWIPAFAGMVAAQQAAAVGPYCPAAVYQVPDRPVVDVELETGDTYINADNIDEIEEGVLQLKGAVEMTTNDWQARAEEALYNEPANYIDLFDDVKFWDESLFLSGDTARINTEDNATATVTAADYYLPDNGAWGKADELFINPDVQTSGEKMSFTTCAQDNEGWFGESFWHITARKLTLNHETDRGAGRDIVLRIKNIPVFYSPYFTFPLSQERESGFLAPGVGRSGHGGFETRLPYYWNISPGMDATITPRYLSDSGVMGMLEYRYLFERGTGEVTLEYLPGDSAFDDRDRSFISVKHSQKLLDRGQLYVDYNRASDQEYLEDFGSQLSISSTRYLPQRLDFRYRGNSWLLRTRLQNYQTVDPGVSVISKPYKKLPQVEFHYWPLSGNKKINLSLLSDFTYFDRTGETGVTVNVTGFRADLYPSISYPMRTNAAFLIPKVGVRYTQYNLTEQGSFSKSPNRTVPIVSVDSGVFLQRVLNLQTTDYLHTLEPRLFYLYIPYDDQSDLPIFDSSVFNLDYNALFRENRFSGYDRIGDTNQLTLALASRLISQKTGKQTVSLKVAQSFYLKDQNVIKQIMDTQGQLVDVGIVENDFMSPLIIEANANLYDDLRLRGQLYWDPKDNLTRKMVVSVQYNPPGNKVINLAYRVRRAETGQVRRLPTDIEQSDVSFSWPLTGNLNTVGRWNYAVAERRSLDLFFGVEYETCCFAIRAIGRRFLSHLEGDFNTGFFLQLQLKGLGSLGQRAAELLHNAIPGYQDSWSLP